MKVVLKKHSEIFGEGLVYFKSGVLKKIFCEVRLKTSEFGTWIFKTGFLGRPVKDS